jgi:peptide/nickel transport system substrate-binding protein
MLKQYFVTYLSMVMLLLSACTTATPEATSSPETSADTQTEAVDTTSTRCFMRVPYFLWHDGKETLDPASPVQYSLAAVMLYDTLVQLAEDGVPAPRLATAWTASEDATEWTFTLRDDVTFHNGQALTSADVAYTFEHILDPKTFSPATATLGLISEIETPDAQTIIFKLSKGHADFPLLLISRLTGIIPADSADTIGNTGIGTGPFKLQTLDVEGTTVLSANDDYWAGKPGLAGIELPALADSESRVLALQSGQVDLVLDVTSAQADLFASDEDFTVLRYPSGKWAALVMRTDTPPFDDVRVRQAIRLAADRQAIIDLVLNGAGTITCDTPVAPNDVYRWETDCPQDIEQAKALLAEAGYADGLDVTLYTSDSSQEQIPLAEVYQQQAAAAGINVTLEIAPSDSFWTDVWSVEPFVTTFWSERPADEILSLAWRSSSTWNESHFQNPDFDQLLDDARIALDFETRRETYRATQQLIYEEGGHLIPFHTDQFHVASAKLSGVPARDFHYIEWHKISKSK